MSDRESRRSGRVGTVRRLRLWIALRIAPTLALWQGRRRQRAVLATLETHHLQDLGLSPGEAQRESAKPFWR